jgi:hypothetical protein
MEAISKRTEHVLHGKIAEILLRKGSATPIEGSEPKKKVPRKPKATKKAKK